MYKGSAFIVGNLYSVIILFDRPQKPLLRFIYFKLVKYFNHETGYQIKVLCLAKLKKTLKLILQKPKKKKIY